jgi:hypothetical protein
MPAPIASMFGTRSNTIREILNDGVETFIAKGDPVFEGLSIGQGDASGQMGRDGLIHKHFAKGLSGVISGGGRNRDMVLYGDPNNVNLGAKLFRQNVTRTFPDPTQGTKQQTFRLSIPMRGMETNLMMTLGEMQLEATKANIYEVLMPTLQGFARNMSQMVTNYFWISQNDFYSLAALGGGSGTGWNKTLDTNTTIMVDLKFSNYAVNRFMEGMRVQIYDATGATLRTHAAATNNSIFIVTQVDEVTGQIYLKAWDGSAVNGAALADTDIIVYAESKGDANTPYASGAFFTGIAGIRSWMKFGGGGNDNVLLGAEATNESPVSGRIDVTVHPEFKSLSFNRGGQALTEHYMRQVVSSWNRSKERYGQTIDTFVASDGVWLAYETQLLTKQVIDRTGRLNNVNTGQGSAEGFTFEFGGRKYTGKTSHYIESGVMYGLKTQNNWKKYSPANYKGLKSLAQVDKFIPFEFVGAALNGTDSHMIPMLLSPNGGGIGAVTEGVQMPGMFRMQLVPDQVTGLRVFNVAEERLYAS